MSQRERDRLEVMARVVTGQATHAGAVRLLRWSSRQIREIQRRIEAEGDHGLIHSLRGCPSNNRKDRNLRQRIIETYGRDQAGLGP